MTKQVIIAITQSGRWARNFRDFHENGSQEVFIARNTAEAKALLRTLKPGTSVYITTPYVLSSHPQPKYYEAAKAAFEEQGLVLVEKFQMRKMPLFSPTELKSIKQLRVQGLTPKEIGRKIGRSAVLIRKHLLRA